MSVDLNKLWAMAEAQDYDSDHRFLHSVHDELNALREAVRWRPYTAETPTEEGEYLVFPEEWPATRPRLLVWNNDPSQWEGVWCWLPIPPLTDGGANDGP